MRKIILIGGDLASGKSTYSKFISKKFGLSLINKDTLKEILGDNILVTTRAENKKLSVISFELIKYFINNTTCDLIVESNFKPYEMEELKKYEDNNSILSLHFFGDNKILHDRFIKRLELGRHYVHKSQDFSNIDDFIHTLEELRNVNYIGNVVNVDATKYSNLEEDEDLLQVISSFLK